jgi:hypothetical protein
VERRKEMRKKKSFILFGRETSNNGSMGSEGERERESCLFLFVTIFNVFFDEKIESLGSWKIDSLSLI